jgi:hypothetical protein
MILKPANSRNLTSWTLSNVPTTGSILICSHFVQTVFTSRLPLIL